MSKIHYKWFLLNIISNGFNSLMILYAEFFKILSHVNITVTFETDIVSAEHYQYFTSTTNMFSLRGRPLIILGGGPIQGIVDLWAIGICGDSEHL